MKRKISDIKLCLRNNNPLYSTTDIKRKFRKTVEIEFEKSDCDPFDRIQISKAIVDWFYQTHSKIIRDYRLSKEDILVIDYTEVYD